MSRKKWCVTHQRKLSEIRVKVSRNYRGVDYSVEVTQRDLEFGEFGKVVRAVEEFIDSNMEKEKCQIEF